MSDSEAPNDGQTSSEAQTAGETRTASEAASGRESRARLTAFRESPGKRRLLTLAGLVVGLAAALGHWLGFVVGGALVALPQVSLGRGLVAGLAFGVVGWLVFLATLGTAGVVDTYAQMTPVLAVSTATPVLGGLLGSLARGVV